MSELREFTRKKQIIRASARLKMKCPEEGIGTKQMSEKWASTVALIQCLVYKPKRSKSSTYFCVCPTFYNPQYHKTDIFKHVLRAFPQGKSCFHYRP